MSIAELRRILRRYKLHMRKRDAALIISNKDCPYEVCLFFDGQREWRFDINPEKYSSEEEVVRKIEYELREEYINPMG